MPNGDDHHQSGRPIAKAAAGIAASALLSLAWACPARGQGAPVRIPGGDVIVVTAGAVPSTLNDSLRTVEVIGREEIETAPVHSVQELLEDVAGVDVRQRGPMGVQADLSLRGSTFEQVLVLIDGVPLTDPQTGHNTLDLPLTLNDIERIEVLKGPGSRQFGANAFGGVIDIVTRKGADKAANAGVQAGEHGIREGDLSFAYPVGLLRQRLSASRATSSGYMDDTDFQTTTLYYGSSLTSNSTAGSFDVGYVDKRFGANAFYSDLFRNEWEHTRALFTKASLDATLGGVTLSPALYWRHHTDDFVLDRSRPDWYRNHHTTDVAGFQARALIPSDFGTWALGGDVRDETITSTNLGDHARTTAGLSLEDRIDFAKDWTISAGGYLYRTSGWGTRAWPGLDLGWRPGGRFKLYASAGKSFRVPTYTELYYKSPALSGNPALRPEEAWTYEAGGSWRGDGWLAAGSLFRREGRDLIDYVRASPADPWIARNLTRVNTTGLEVSATLYPERLALESAVKRLRVSYAFLDSSKASPGFESRYLLDHFRHQVLIDLDQAWGEKVVQTWRARFEQRPGEGRQVVVDTRLTRDLRRVAFYLEATNLLNRSYAGAANIPMPGRWIKVGVRLKTSP